MKNMFFYNTTIGKLGIVGDDDAIVNIYFECDKIPKDIKIKETDIIKKASIQILEYLDGKRKIFDIKLSPQGTKFFNNVWNVLQEIPYGTSVSYKDIAVLIGNEKACRAVGNANNKNPIPIFIPCHRVVGKSGKLTGYRGGLDIKRKLLDIEKENILKK